MNGILARDPGITSWLMLDVLTVFLFNQCYLIFPCGKCHVSVPKSCWHTLIIEIVMDILLETIA